MDLEDVVHHIAPQGRPPWTPFWQVCLCRHPCHAFQLLWSWACPCWRPCKRCHQPNGPSGRMQSKYWSASSLRLTCVFQWTCDPKRSIAASLMSPSGHWLRPEAPMDHLDPQHHRPDHRPGHRSRHGGYLRYPPPSRPPIIFLLSHYSCR